jgi:hypothetical protein
VWSHGIACVPVLEAWMRCTKRGSSWPIAPMCADMLPTKMSDPLGGVYVTSRPNKDEFEPTSGPSVSDMVCVGSCPTLLVEVEAHQNMNPSTKCISTPG